MSSSPPSAGYTSVALVQKKSIASEFRTQDCQFTNLDANWNMKDVLGHSSGREYENLIMDCCQMEDSVQTVKREETGGNDPENGSPDADRGGEYPGCLCEIGKST